MFAVRLQIDVERVPVALDRVPVVPCSPALPVEVETMALLCHVRV